MVSRIKSSRVSLTSSWRSFFFDCFKVRCKFEIESLQRLPLISFSVDWTTYCDRHSFGILSQRINYWWHITQCSTFSRLPLGLTPLWVKYWRPHLRKTIPLIFQCNADLVYSILKLLKFVSLCFSPFKFKVLDYRVLSCDWMCLLVYSFRKI